ncbi:unnamed protein product, partial [Brassica napus]
MMIFQIWKSLMRLTMWWKMIRCVSFVHCQLILWLMNLMMITFSELRTRTNDNTQRKHHV